MFFSWTVTRSSAWQVGSVTVKLELWIMTTLAHPMIAKALDIARFTAHVEAFLDASSKLELH